MSFRIKCLQYFDKIPFVIFGQSTLQCQLKAKKRGLIIDFAVTFASIVVICLFLVLGFKFNTNISLRDYNQYPNYLQIYWNYFILPSVGYCIFVALLLSRDRTMRKVLRRKLKGQFYRIDQNIELNPQNSNSRVSNLNNNLP